MCTARILRSCKWGRWSQPVKLDVYLPVGLALLAGYGIARLIVRRDPSGHARELERRGVPALIGMTILVIAGVVVETQLPAGELRTALRAVLIFVTAAGLTAAVSTFLIYAKIDASSRDGR